MSIPSNLDNATFASRVNIYAHYISQWAVRKGFRNPCATCDGGGTIVDGRRCPDCLGSGADQFRNFGEQVALCHSELSELLEAHRNGQAAAPDEHCPEFNKMEIELADLIIRALDVAATYRCRIGEAIVAKMAVNENRPHKHGKSY